MDKKKKNNKLGIEKEMSKILSEIEKHDFKTVEELNDFLNGLMGQSLDELPKSTDKKSRSMDLVYDAYEQPVTKGKKLVKQALELDPDNAEAYNYLANVEKDIDKAIKLYEKAIKAAEKTLGKKFFEEEKGYFWGILETRPYMRAKAGLADCLHAKNEIDKAIEIYEELLELNPNDNQGIRYLLATLLLEKNDLKKYEEFIKNYEDEDIAVWNYNNALYSFKKFGAVAKSEKKLLHAYNSNPHVIDYLLGYKELPDNPPAYISIGNEDEAVSYIFGSLKLWLETKDALQWLFEFKQKRLKMN